MGIAASATDNGTDMCHSPCSRDDTLAATAVKGSAPTSAPSKGDSAAIREESPSSSTASGFSTRSGSASSSSNNFSSLDAPVVDAQATVADLLQNYEVKPWNSKDFQQVRSLQKALANQGRVELMKSLSAGSFVAVKKMPNDWAMTGHAEFRRAHPKSREHPWLDICITKFLHQEGFPYMCQPLGVFRDRSSTYVVSELASMGDLFGCLNDSQDGLFCLPGPTREARIWPLAHQILSAVLRLHEMGIAHRDISPENIVLHQEDGLIQARLIDFGMATFGRQCNGSHGKCAFGAPEMHLEAAYDSFSTDAFALGVVLFAMATSDYPWSTTKPGECHIYTFVQANGLRSFVARRRIMADKSRRLGDAMSTTLLDLLVGLLAFNPDQRLTLGETCSRVTGGGSVFDSDWLQTQPQKAEAELPLQD